MRMLTAERWADVPAACTCGWAASCTPAGPWTRVTAAAGCPADHEEDG